MVFDWLIVGSGITSCTIAERIASQLGQTVLIVEKRNHIGGNCYDYFNEHGVLVHKYGSHIFHTNSDWVWKYLSHFTPWRPYFHHVLASVEGHQVPVPFNLNSLSTLFPARMSQHLEEQLVEQFGFGSKVPILKLRESSSGDLRTLADYVYENIFLHYTKKQWDLTPEELSPSVTARVPVYISRDNRYFQDTYQAMPLYGYTEMMNRMLTYPQIKILLNASFRDVEKMVNFKRLIFTGPIDEYFDFQLGFLPYRSLEFVFETLTVEQFLETTTINYPNEYDFTRITEFKQMTGQRSLNTTIMYEYPKPHIPGKTIPYYPIPRDETRALLTKYESAAKDLSTVYFVGRLADYKYYNIDQAVARALRFFENEVTKIG